MPTCRRCGQCCENMALGVSPKKLEQYYLNWLHDKKDSEKPREIYTLFFMLLPIGYDKRIRRYRYKCKHLIRKGKKAFCSIYKYRPNYPCKDYGLTKQFKMGITGSSNKDYYPNCVF